MKNGMFIDGKIWNFQQSKVGKPVWSFQPSSAIVQSHNIILLLHVQVFSHACACMLNAHTHSHSQQILIFFVSSYSLAPCTERNITKSLSKSMLFLCMWYVGTPLIPYKQSIHIDYYVLKLHDIIQHNNNNISYYYYPTSKIWFQNR